MRGVTARSSYAAGWAVVVGLCSRAVFAQAPGDVPSAVVDPPPADAATHFAEGERAFARGDFVRAGVEFEASYAAAPHPTPLWNAAKSWERAGEAVRSANLYRRFIEEAPAGTPNRDRATTALSELSRTLGRVEVVAPGASETFLDERPLVRSPVSFVSPGSHLVSAVIAGERVSERVSLEAGETKTVVLERKTLAPVRPEAPAKPPVAADGSRGATPWLFVPFAGATAVGVGLVLWSGIDTLVARAQYDELGAVEQALVYDQGKLKQDRTNVIVGITGGLALVSGVLAVFAIDWGHGTLVGVSPTEARVVVRF